MSNSTREKPKYLKLVEELRQRIDAGELRYGDRLPTYVELRRSHGLTQPTIERSHGILEKDGYIERVAGKGTFVSSPNAAKNGLANQNLLDNSIVVLTAGAGPHRKYRMETGWSEYIALGAINEIRTGSRHVMAVASDNLQTHDLEYFLQRPPAGVIIVGEPLLTGTMLETAMRLQDAGVPVVLYGDGPELTRFDRVISDHEQGSYELTRWLIGRGHRRILRVAPLLAESYWLQMRERGYLRAMTGASLSPMETCPYLPSPNIEFPNLEDDRSSFEGSARTMAHHLAPYVQRDEPVEAIMAITDGEVYVLAAACRLLGKEPDKDVFFVGYDHYWRDLLELERTFERTTPLATVDKRNVQLGEALVQLLNERIEGRCDAAPQFRLLPPRLVVHSS